MIKTQTLEKRFSIISPKSRWQEMGATIETPEIIWIDNEIYVSEENCQKLLEKYKAQYEIKHSELNCIEPQLFVNWVVIEEKDLTNRK